MRVIEAVLCETCNELMDMSDVLRGTPSKVESTWFCKQGHTITIKTNELENLTKGGRK